jgi:hypothetical protein
VAIKFFGGFSDCCVGVPFQETGVCYMAISIREIFRVLYLLFKPRNFLKSFSEQTPHDRLASIPMISWRRITEGVPRAPKAAAWCEVLKQCVNSNDTESGDHERIHEVICKVGVLECTLIGSFFQTLKAANGM